jgi:DNA-3-methyladenine glycosylase II
MDRRVDARKPAGARRVPGAAAALSPIETDADVAAGLAALLAADARLGPVAAVAGALPLRRHPPGFAGLARVVVGQQLSTASAAAIWGRLEAAGGATPAGFLALDDAALRACGLSVAKVRTLRSLAGAAGDGSLDFAELSSLPAEAAHARLVALPGIGPWTVDVYLLFCAGHPDIFPAGDLALQVAVADAFGLDGRPSVKALAALAAPWAPWRAVAARLFWAYYRARRAGRDGVPI